MAPNKQPAANNLTTRRSAAVIAEAKRSVADAQGQSIASFSYSAVAAEGVPGIWRALGT